MDDTRKKLYLITDAYWPVTGGVESWVHAHSVHLAKQFRVTILTHDVSGNLNSLLSKTVFLRPFPRHTDDAGNDVIPLSPSLFGRIIMLPFLLWSLPFAKKLLAKPLFDFLYIFYKTAYFSTIYKLTGNADIVHCFSTGYLAACTSDVCARRKIKLVQSPAVHFGKWGDSPLLLRSYAKADVVTCLSNSAQQKFENLLPKSRSKIVTIPALTINTDMVIDTVTQPKSPVILFLGRREKHKGLDLLCCAMERLLQPATLVIAGPTTASPKYHKSIVDLGAVSESQKQSLLANCALLSVPSSDESFGIVYIEAMRYAKPVVALNIAPVNEIVVHNETGLLVPPDDPAALGEAIDALLADQKLRETLGANGRKRYEENFSPEIVMEQILLLYRNL